MRLFLITAIALMVGLAACGKSEETSTDDAGGPADKMLANMDKDGDKVVSREEFAAHFSDIDTDGDGSISKAEMESHHQEVHGNAHSDAGDESHFSKIDADNNGSLTPEEFATSFNIMDKDKNGQLMRGELLQHVNPTN